jgi:hypothetical protein
MQKLWGVVALVGCVALGGGAGVWAEDTDHQAERTGFTTAQVNAIFQACQDTAAKTPSPLRKTPGTKMWCAVVNREGVLRLIRATDTGGTPVAPGGVRCVAGEY